MEVLRSLNELGQDITGFKVKPEVLAELVKRVEARELSSTVGKEILDTLAREDVTLDDAAKRAGASSGRITGGALVSLVEKILADNPDVVETITSGQDKKGGKLKFLQGQIMKEAKGQADPKEAADALAARLGP
jgi:aspartyl-tRNA(Asn)/glutamyl-tRNA(Gln) amidotransferase subunit B